MTAATALLADLRSADESAYGGKSAALGELLGGGIPVPPGFAVSTAAFAAFVEETGLGARIVAALDGLDLDDVGAVRAASEAIGRDIGALAVPDRVRAEVAERYAALAEAAGEAEPGVAVRSSACGEDSADATFAGQQETSLWVRGADDVCAAVRDCWASLYSPEAIAYRAKMGDPGDVPAMGVTVQIMADAAVSGVMFTCNPVSGDPSVVAVNASWGLGLGVVGGDVTPDEYLVSKVSRDVLRRTVSHKHVEYRPAEGGRGTVRVDVGDDRADAECLGDDALRELLAVARTVERHFGGHQDIEWAIAHSGDLFVLQSRPVTAVHRPEGPKGASALSLVMSTFGVAPKAGE